MASLKQQQEHQKKLAFWKLHIQAQSSSQLTVLQYCQKYDLKRYQFKYWSQLLKKTNQQQLQQDFKLIELTPAAVKSSTTITLTAPNGFVIQFEQPSLELSLKTVLSAIQSQS